LDADMSAALERNLVSTFLASMPAHYGERFDLGVAREHAAIAERRRSGAVHAEIWRALPGGVAGVCVLADDRPGLLSFVSAALVVHGLDVEAAHAFTRATDPPEAFDVFWLRRDGGIKAAVMPGDIVRVVETLQELVTDRKTIDEVAREAHRRRTAVPPAGSTRVAWVQESPGETVLTVETFDRPGLLLAITSALFRARVQIVSSEATISRGRIVDRFTLVEFDGAPLRASRRGTLQVAVLAAVDALRERR
jgi:[protein-PII] uridylyltransferase